MALIVENGTGLPTAEAYGSVVEAESYFRRRGSAAARARWVGTKASASLTLAANPTDGDTLTIGSKTYTLQTTLSDTDGNIQIDDTLADTAENIVAAVNLGPGAGDAYAASTSAHPEAESSGVSSSVVAFRAISEGAGGNLLASTETFTDAGNVFAAATFVGGANPTLSIDEKEDLSSIGSEYLDLTYGGRWKGVRIEELQGRDWPRFGATDEEGFVFDSDVVPSRVKEASFEAADRSATEADGLIPDIDTPGSVVDDLLKVDVITLRTSYAGGASQVKKFRTIDLMVAGLIQASNRVRRA